MFRLKVQNISCIVPDVRMISFVECFEGHLEAVNLSR
jgi:hypothetical protein